MISINVKKLNQMSKDNTYVNTGFYVYIDCNEVWTKAVYYRKKTDFFVSSLGRVYDKKKNKYVKLFINGDGYIYCQSYHKYKTKRCTVMINRLVLESFKGLPKNIKNAQADHINRKTLDNRLDNLQWLSPKENLKKRVYNQKGENNNASKYKNEDIFTVANYLMEGKTNKEIQQLTGMPNTSINNIRYKYRWANLLKDYEFPKLERK